MSSLKLTFLGVFMLVPTVAAHGSNCTSHENNCTSHQNNCTTQEECDRLQIVWLEFTLPVQDLRRVRLIQILWTRGQHNTELLIGPCTHNTGICRSLCTLAPISVFYFSLMLDESRKKKNKYKYF
ncbi:hypothetical protein ABFS83_12G086600 [Erythranthe nasuta]